MGCLKLFTLDQFHLYLSSKTNFKIQIHLNQILRTVSYLIHFKRSQQTIYVHIEMNNRRVINNIEHSNEPQT